MRYVGGGANEQGCIFCSRWAATDDSASLILHRGQRSFAILNLYPYNTGHLMQVPVDHVASPEDLSPAAMLELATVLPLLLRAARRALSCHGFNVGMNLGAVAGAGIADHLHQHIVPRWQGDANFMPIIAGTMVLPELVPATYGKLRAEVARELGHGDEVVCLGIVTTARGANWIARRADGSGRLPVARAMPDEPLWQAATRELRALTGGVADILGWAGDNRADNTAPTALVCRITGVDPTAEAGPTNWAAAVEAAAGPEGIIVAAGLEFWPVAAKGEV